MLPTIGFRAFTMVHEVRLCTECASFIRGDFPRNEDDYPRAHELFNMLWEYEQEHGEMVNFILNDTVQSKCTCTICERVQSPAHIFFTELKKENVQ